MTDHEEQQCNNNISKQKKDDEYNRGLAPIKAQYIATSAQIEYDTKYISSVKNDGDQNSSSESIKVVTTQNEDGTNVEKRKESSSSVESERREKKRLKGQNKNRKNFMFKERKQLAKANGERLRMCMQFCANGQCPYGDKCTFSHDLDAFVATKEEDIADKCFCYDTYGKCNYGVLCRFGSSHLKDGKYNVVDEEKYTPNKCRFRNALNKDVQFQLRKKKYDFSKANVCSKMITSGKLTIEDAKKEPRAVDLKKKLDWNGKLYLAPLTTVGNLPFRRICKEFGADITCGEMALCANILEGSPSEWALLRRHHTEDFFGVQICGSQPDQLARCAQLINEQCDVDFIDLNMGCPIDLIYRKGAGSALLERKKRLDEIIYSVTSVTDIPLTLKMRAGVYRDKYIAKGIVSTVREWGQDRVNAITLHGRTREQRYIKLADWQYIQECAAEATRSIEGCQPIAFFGSGDVISHEEYYERMESSGVNGIMLARGALIKPWLFTEIKERRTWDISAQERLDILKRYVNYGLENWGSDNEGVEKTRRFLLEWLSFLHRYIPVGLLERLPQRVNERPPRYFARNDLETLFCSGSCKDWITISEMLLGKVPAEFSFIPKHKANAY